MKVHFREFDGWTDWNWVRNKVSIKRVEDTRGIVAVNAETGKLLGACLFDNFLHNSAQAALVIENSMIIKHGFLDCMYQYLFDFCKKTYCYVLIAETNYKSIRICKRLGFVEQWRMPEAYSQGVDFILMQLHKDNWMGGKKQIKEAA